jgi:hypothetical protein
VVGFVEIVRREHHGEAFELRQRGDLGPHVRSGLRIETRRGLKHNILLKT